MLLRFYEENNQIMLKETAAEMIDITDDFRTKLIKKQDLLHPKFRVAPNVFIVSKPLFIQLAKTKNRQTIEALYINHLNNHIIIVGDNAYVYYNGKDVSVKEYEIDISMSDLQGLKLF